MPPRIRSGAEFLCDFLVALRGELGDDEQCTARTILEALEARARGHAGGWNEPDTRTGRENRLCGECRSGEQRKGENENDASDHAAL